MSFEPFRLFGQNKKGGFVNPIHACQPPDGISMPAARCHAMVQAHTQPLDIHRHIALCIPRANTLCMDASDILWFHPMLFMVLINRFIMP